jgi:hypothetical protein
LRGEGRSGGGGGHPKAPRGDGTGGPNPSHVLRSPHSGTAPLPPPTPDLPAARPSPSLFMILSCDGGGIRIQEMSRRGWGPPPRLATSSPSVPIFRPYINGHLRYILTDINHIHVIQASGRGALRAGDPKFLPAHFPSDPNCLPPGAQFLTFPTPRDRHT